MSIKGTIKNRCLFWVLLFILTGCSDGFKSATNGISSQGSTTSDEGGILSLVNSVDVGAATLTMDRNFPTVTVGDSVIQRITIYNIGNGREKDVTTSIDGVSFSIESTTCLGELGPKEPCYINVRFAPNSVGLHAGLVQVQSIRNQLTVNLEGLGTSKGPSTTTTSSSTTTTSSSTTTTSSSTTTTSSSTTTTSSSTTTTSSSTTTTSSSTTTTSSSTTTTLPDFNGEVVVIDWDYADRDDLRSDPTAQVSDVYVDGDGGPIPREEIVDVAGHPWAGAAKALRVNYDGTGDNDGRIGGEQYGGSVRYIPGVLGDGIGGSAEPRHVWIRTWVYLAPNFDGWGWKMLHLRSPTGTRTEVKPYANSMHPVIDNNSSWQTDYVGRDVAGLDRGRWIEILIERKLANDGLSDGIFRVRWAGQVVSDYEGIAPIRDSEVLGGFTAFHQNIAFGKNTGPTQQTYVLWGPAEIMFTDPGWAW